MIKFECCHCAQHIEAPDEFLNALIDCPGCARKVKVQPMKEPETSFAPDAPARVPAPNFMGTESEKCQRHAFWLEVSAALVGIVGGIVGFKALGAKLAGDDPGIGFWIAGCLIGAAFWFYLIAQLVHIRALLAKK